MSGCLNAFRWFLVTILIGFLFLSLVILLPLSVVSNTLSNRDHLKTFLARIDIYQQVPLIIDNLAIGQIGGTISEPTSKDQTNQLSIDQILTPQSIETKVNTVLDAWYDWMEEKTNYPEFSISLFDSQAEMNQFIAAGLEQKIADLPACKSNYVPPTNINPFEIDCLPQGMSAHDLDIDQFLDQMMDDQHYNQLQADTTISSANLKLDTQTLDSIKSYYQLSRLLPYLIIGLSLILILFIVLITPQLRYGLLISGLVLIFVSLGFFLTIVMQSSILGKIFTQLPIMTPGDIPPAFLDQLKPLISNIFNVFNQKLLIYNLIVLFIGGILTAASFFIKGKSENEDKNVDQDKSNPPTTAPKTVDSTQTSS